MSDDVVDLKALAAATPPADPPGGEVVEALEAKWRRRLSRERRARQQAENLLEVKSLQLHQANVRLQQQADGLEAEVARRTAELRHAREVAQQASRAKSEFLAVMSHEIRTPMHAVLGCLDLLEAQALPSKAVTLVGYAKHSATLLLGLLNDILDFSKIEAGRLILAPRPTELRAFAHGLERMMQPRVEGKAVQLTVRVADDVPDRVVVDDMRLQQVATNLLSNAAKFTAQGEIALTFAGGGDGRLQLVCSDTGCGIAPDALETLFDDFTQAEACTTRRYGGTGLGLTITRRLVELMGGAIDVTSEVGVGTTFSAVVAVELATDAGEAADREVAEARWLAGMSVLVVDDNPVNRMVGRRMLERLGCEAQVASGGQEALEAVASGVFDLVLMDCQMPGLDGYETTRRLRAAGYRQPIIAMTANATAEDRARCQAAGMDDFLAKPTPLEALAVSLRRWRLAAGGVGEQAPTSNPPIAT